MNMPTRPELEAAEAAAALAYAEALAPPRATGSCACGECADCWRAEQEALDGERAMDADEGAESEAFDEAFAEDFAESSVDEGCSCVHAAAEDAPEASEVSLTEATRADDRARAQSAGVRRDRTAVRRRTAFVAPAPAPAAAAPLPFQFQIPIGGGSPALSVPVGGAGSPLAFAVPLGGTPPAPPAAQPPYAPYAPPGEPTAAVATAAPSSEPGDAPLNIVTSIDFPAGGEAWPDESAEHDSGEDWAPGAVLPSAAAQAGIAMLREAEAACAEDVGPSGSAQLVARLLDAAHPGARLLSGAGAPSATALFNAFEYGHGHPMRPRLRDRYARHLRRLAGPGNAIDGLEVRAGDWVVRVALGQGFGQLSVVASPLVGSHDELAGLGWRTGGSGGIAPAAGRYLQVVEVLPIRRPAADRWARRIADQRGRILPGNLLLRPYGRDAEWEEGGGAEAVGEDMLEAIAHDAATDVRWLQDALNRVMGLRLTVDGAAGPQTRQAVRSFQSSRGLSVDGIAGTRTIAALRSALGGAAPTVTSGRSGVSPTPVSPGTGPDCSQLTHFSQGRDDLSPAHQTLLIAAARRIQAEGIRVVLVTGFASSEGGDADNFVLGQRRADRVARELKTTLDRMRPGSSAGVAMIATSRGESEQTAGGDLALNRRVTLCLQVNRVPPRPRPQPQPVAVETKVFRIVAKSFIDRVGSRIGSLDCGIDIGPITVPGASNLGLRGLAFATDQAFSENPTSDAIFTSPPPESKGYRLFSRGMLSVERRGNEAVSASLAGGLTTDAGKECVPGTGLCLQAPSLIVDQPFSTRRIDASRIAFRWGVKGRPPRAAEPAFEAICHRDCVFIWHQVKGTIDCSSGTALITNLVVEGSRFPSHKVWLDGAQGAPVPQGPLSNLWDSAAGDPSRVR